MIGFVCLIVGIALAITAELGVGSWQVLETGLVALTGASFGLVATVEAALALTIAWVWLKQPPWIATVLLGLGGIAIGALLGVMDTPEGMLARIGLLGVGLPLMVVGVAFYLASDLGASAQDAIFVGLYRRYALRPSRVRFVMDGALVLVGALIGGQFGLGTVAVTIGLPAMIDPALRLGHRLADTPLPAGLIVATQPLVTPERIQAEDGATGPLSGEPRNRRPPTMTDVPIQGAGIRLGQFLKLVGIIGQGSEAKLLLGEERVLVNDEVEVRRGRQLARGDRVTIDQATFTVT